MKNLYFVLCFIACSFSEPLESYSDSAISTTDVPLWKDDPCVDVISSSRNPNSWLSVKDITDYFKMDCEIIFDKFRCDGDTKQIFLSRSDLIEGLVNILYKYQIWNFDCKYQIFKDVTPEQTWEYENIQMMYCLDILWEEKNTYFCPNYMATKQWWMVMLPRLNNILPY